eukprot:TRINITY_DN13629_c0_g1_i1.p1 TRINITY_DN13629_c0_g1~~TRINITY_DN13629_c0_g1_i1.p1  ORF type:complete len:188 (+),score=26.85 TRINITY_DN13629_c0_g1_i1:27-566(+)
MCPNRASRRLESRPLMCLQLLEHREGRAVPVQELPVGRHHLTEVLLQLRGVGVHRTEPAAGELREFLLAVRKLLLPPQRQVLGLQERTHVPVEPLVEVHHTGELLLRGSLLRRDLQRRQRGVRHRRFGLECVAMDVSSGDPCLLAEHPLLLQNGAVAPPLSAPSPRCCAPWCPSAPGLR